jgi:hypothetical protein
MEQQKLRIPPRRIRKKRIRCQAVCRIVQRLPKRYGSAGQLTCS